MPQRRHLIHPRASHSPRLVRLTILLVLFAPQSLLAQEVGGAAAAFLQAGGGAAQAAMGGTALPWTGPEGAIYGGSSELGGLAGPIAITSASLLPAGRSFVSAGVALPVGGFAGVSFALTSYTVSGFQGYTVDGTPTGAFSSSDVAVSVGSGIALGSGGVGATIRYLSGSASKSEGSVRGFTLDLSGSLRFQEKWLLHILLGNVAGEVRGNWSQGVREPIPWRMRIGAAYLLSFDERSERVRLDPSGIAFNRPLPPRSYLLVALEGRTSAIDSSAAIALAGEWMPLVEIPLGLRIGADTHGDVGIGFFYTLPVAITPEIRVAVSARRNYEVGDITQHVSISAAF